MEISVWEVLRLFAGLFWLFYPECTHSCSLSKAAFALCFFGAASAEATAEASAAADAYYGHYGYSHLLGHAHAQPHFVQGHGHGYYEHGYYGKRSADAEPVAEADAYYGFGHGLIHGYGHYPVVSTIHGLHGHGYYGHSLGHYYSKRSAEAEPTAVAEAAPEAAADPYYHHGYGHAAYGYAHHGYGHGYGHGFYGHPYAYGGYYGYHH